MDVILRHLVSVVAEAEGEMGPEDFGRDVHRLKSYLYADNGLLESTRVERLQELFRLLTDLFDRVGLRTNVGMVVSFSCQPCLALGVHSMEVYGLRIMGWGGPIGRYYACASDVRSVIRT